MLYKHDKWFISDALCHIAGDIVAESAGNKSSCAVYARVKISARFAFVASFDAARHTFAMAVE